MIAYKLFHQRKNATLGPLFIHRKLIIPVGEWLEAENHPTKGYAIRPGWHACPKRHAPHLRQDGDRVWCKVELGGRIEEHHRPKSQGGKWLLAQKLKVLKVF